MENHHFQWLKPLEMAMFNSYVSLPEGIDICFVGFRQQRFCCIQISRKNGQLFCWQFSATNLLIEGLQPTLIKHIYIYFYIYAIN